ncbi:hypothetical protein MNB_SV-15-737 [hydrothermal vent metagenome]|uniref:Uncharacterized protein n=1 Tax=hydrothermal vent metagenome TaxID=652676 RepID=A0A1W1EKR1_9ZZZZ
MSDILRNTRITNRGTSENNYRWWVTALISLVLSLGTWNPTGFHFLYYITQTNIISGFTPFAILIMIMLWFLAIKSIFQSIGMVGVSFIVITILAFIWGLSQYGLIDLKDIKQLGWVATVGMAFIIWAGLNASILWKKVTGVYHTDVVEDSSNDD